MIIKKLKEFLEEKKRQFRARKRLDNFKKRIIEQDKKTKQMRKEKLIMLSIS